MKKIFTVAMIHNLLKKVMEGEITYSRMVEIMNEEANEAFGLELVSAGETTDGIIKGKKYEVVERVEMGVYIVDESGKATYYSESAFKND